MKEKTNISNIKKGNFDPPNDRELIIRGKLNTGWYSRSSQQATQNSHLNEISEIEFLEIQQVLNRAAQIERQDVARINSLLNQYESINKPNGNGETTCLVCAYQISLLATKSYACNDCFKKSCFECTIDYLMDTNKSLKLCKICHEYREFWKKSGAWFTKKSLKDVKKIQNNSSTVILNSSLKHQQQQQQQQHEQEKNELKEIQEKEEQDDNNKIFEYSNIQINNNLNSNELIIPLSTTFIPKSKSISLSSSSSSKLNESSNKINRKNLSSTPIVITESSSISSSLTNISNLNKSESSLLNLTKSITMSQSQLDLPKFESNKQTNLKSNLGRLNFSIAYLSSVQQLKIHLKNAVGLPARDANGLSDPYVKCHLLPGVAKSTKLRSKTIYKNLDPIFDEILVYEGISIADIDTKTLRLTVLDEDKIGFDYIGEYRVPLKELKIDQINSFEADLDEVREVNEEEDRKMRGKINIGLKYCTSTKILFVKILRCAQLIPMDGGKSSDPFVEISLSPPDKEPRGKQRTTVKWKTLDPEFNEEFQFSHLDLKTIMSKTIDITVWDKDIGSNDLIGNLKLGQRSKGNELKHFYSALKNPDMYHEQWHDLRLNY